jgi:hypothetical protein
MSERGPQKSLGEIFLENAILISGRRPPQRGEAYLWQTWRSN